MENLTKKIPFKWPRRLPEANIQAQFYIECRFARIPVMLEYKHGGCRFDAVIHDKKDILAIVEVKSYSRNRPPNHNTKQMDRYRSFGVPVYLITRMRDVKPVLNKIKEDLDL